MYLGSWLIVIYYVTQSCDNYDGSCYLILLSSVVLVMMMNFIKVSGLLAGLVRPTNMGH